jgi:DNA modification methylase
MSSVPLNAVTHGDCLELIPQLEDACIDVVVTSPPYWGQRMSAGVGMEADPRAYVESLRAVFVAILPTLKDSGIVWINLGNAYNTPVNWRVEDQAYSSLGPDQAGLPSSNSAYVKPRARRKAFVSNDDLWLTYGNLLALPYRLVLRLCDEGFLFRGEIIWQKRNPMPEGRCRRPHRAHEPIYLLAKSEHHAFRVAPAVKSVWEFPNEKIDGPSHFSRFPTELPKRCIEAYGSTGSEVVVLDPFTGSGTTGVAAMEVGCSFIGLEIDADQVAAANRRLEAARARLEPLFAA